MLDVARKVSLGESEPCVSLTVKPCQELRSCGLQARGLGLCRAWPLVAETNQGWICLKPLTWASPWICSSINHFSDISTLCNGICSYAVSPWFAGTTSMHSVCRDALCFRQSLQTLSEGP